MEVTKTSKRKDTHGSSMHRSSARGLEIEDELKES